MARLKAKLMKRQEVGDVVKVPETAAEASTTSQEEEGSETEEEGPNPFATTGKQPINVTETNKRLADKRDQQIREEVN